MKVHPKKIVIIFNNLNIGGIETKIIDLCQHYSLQKNIKVYLLLKSKSGPLLRFVPKNIYLLSPKTTNSLKIRTLTFSFWLASKLKVIQPNLIITFGNFCSISGVMGKSICHLTTPLIISEDSSITQQLKTDSLSSLRTILVKITYPLATKIIILSKSGQEKLTKLVPSVSDKTQILNNWLPMINIPIVKSNIKKDIDILFLGRFEPQKNPLYFLKISKALIKIIPKIKIVMVGYGSLETKIKKYISENKLDSNISILPQTINPTQYFQRSKIFLLTSDHEGFPLTILEASAARSLPVCKKLSEINDYFSYKSDQILYNTQDQAIKKISKLLNNKIKLRQLSTYYQQKILKDQSQLFTKTIFFINQFL